MGNSSSRTVRAAARKCALWCRWLRGLIRLSDWRSLGGAATLKIMPITVCIVEDDPDLRETIGGYVAGVKGYTCLGVFASGEAALQSIPTLQPDVVLMDINLPGMNGIQCVKKWKEETPKLLMMMLTVYEN